MASTSSNIIPPPSSHDLDADTLIANQVDKLSLSRIRAQDLPFDILSYLFPFCLPDNIFLHPQPNTLVAPLLLCHICSSWRLVALSFCPRLWSSLTLVLEYVTAKHQAGSGFLRRKLEVLQFWCARMGVRRPSFHFVREHLAAKIGSRGDEGFVPSREFLGVPAIRRAEKLTLHGSSSLDFTVFNKILASLGLESSFPYLHTLSVSQPSGREDNTIYLNEMKTPALKRLYVDCFTDQARDPGKVMHIFQWTSLTHLAANLVVRKKDWEAILEGCVSLEYAAFNIRFFSPHPSIPQSPSQFPSQSESQSQKRRLHTHPSLKHLTIHSPSSHIRNGDLFDSLFFPSLIKLRLSHPSPSNEYVPLDALNRMLVATPAVRELHLRTCVGFGVPGFLSVGAAAATAMAGGSNAVTTGVGNMRSRNNTFTGPLSRYLPDLELLVIDAIGYEVRFLALPGDLVAFMKSAWASEGWVGLDGEGHLGLTEQGEGEGEGERVPRQKRRTLRFILDKGYNFSHSIIQSLNQAYNSDPALYNSNPDHALEPVHGHGYAWDMEAAYVPGGVWSWKSLTAVDLEEAWEDLGAWGLGPGLS